MVVQAPVERELIAATAEQRPALEQLFRALEAGPRPVKRPRLIGPDGEHLAFPEPVCDVLRRVIPYLLRGDGVAVVPYHRELTTRQAADLLSMSRQYVVTLCDRGELRCTKTGTHRRIAYADLIAYKRRRDTLRRDGLRELTRMSEELGLYDAPRPASAGATT